MTQEQIEKRREYKRLYKLNHKQEEKERAHQYYLKNKERISEKNKQYRIANPEKTKEFLSDWYYRNRERVIERRMKRYYESKGKSDTQVRQEEDKSLQVIEMIKDYGLNRAELVKIKKWINEEVPFDEKEWKKEYRETHKEEIAKYKKEYAAKNREKQRMYNRNYKLKKGGKV